MPIPTTISITETAGRYYADGIPFLTLKGALSYVSSQSAEPVLYMPSTPEHLCATASSFISPAAYRS